VLGVIGVFSHLYVMPYEEEPEQCVKCAQDSNS